jgi:hypothetical protein
MTISKTLGSLGSGADFQSIFDLMTWASTPRGDDILCNLISNGATVGGGSFLFFFFGESL